MHLPQNVDGLRIWLARTRRLNTHSYYSCSYILWSLALVHSVYAMQCSDDLKRWCMAHLWPISCTSYSLFGRESRSTKTQALLRKRTEFSLIAKSIPGNHLSSKCHHGSTTMPPWVDYNCLKTCRDALPLSESGSACSTHDPDEGSTSVRLRCNRCLACRARQKVHEKGLQ